MEEKYVDIIYSYMNIFLKKIVEKYNANDLEPTETQVLESGKIPVWVLWWQGFDNAPEVVKLCANSMRKNLPDCVEIVWLDQNNYSNYVDLSEIVLRRFAEGVLDIVHFSDVLRVNLLSKYGGMWLDSTYFVANKVPSDFFYNHDFYTQSYGYLDLNGIMDITKGRWATNIFYGKPDNMLFHFLKDSWNFYLERHDKIWDYYLLDFMIAVGYHNVSEIKELIDKCPRNNMHAGDIQSMYGNQELDLDWYNTLTGDTTFYKMTYKAPLKKVTDEGKQTLYGYMCENYL